MKRRNFLGAALAFCGLGWMAKPKDPFSERAGLEKALYFHTLGRAKSSGQGLINVQVFEQGVGAMVHPSTKRLIAKSLVGEIKTENLVYVCRDERHQYFITASEC